jgi:hypothetical protein
VEQVEGAMVLLCRRLLKLLLVQLIEVAGVVEPAV